MVMSNQVHRCGILGSCALKWQRNDTAFDLEKCVTETFSISEDYQDILMPDNQFIFKENIK